MKPPVSAFIALGANLGDARGTVLAALDDLSHLPHTSLVRASSLYRTAPWEASGPDFINAVAEVETRLSAPALLSALHDLEHRAGRLRPYRNAPRTLDLDILLYGNAFMDSPKLHVPHPRMKQRAFVMVPLAEIAPQRVEADVLKAVLDQPIDKLT